MAFLNINPEIVCSIIDKAREFHAKEGVTFPDRPEEVSEEDMLQILADHQNDLTYQEVSIAINDLEPDQKITLIALLYLGRGDYDMTEWKEAWQLAAQTMPKDVAAYLLSNPQLGDFLEEALSQFGYSCNE